VQSTMHRLLYAPWGIKQLLRSALTWKCSHWQRRLLLLRIIYFGHMSLIRSRALEVSAPPASFPVSEASGLSPLWPAYFSGLRVALQAKTQTRTRCVSVGIYTCE